LDNFGQLILAIATGATIPVLVKIAESHIDRKQRRPDRRDDLALQNLLDLQRALVELREAVGKINRFQVMYAKEHNKPWSNLPMGPEATELSDNASQAEFEVLMFSVRMKDQVLRDLVQECVEAKRALSGSWDSDEINSLSKQISLCVRKANDRIGELIREL
jgi:hypothetical protein